LDINFQCVECNSHHKDTFLPYRGNPNFGNCEYCGNFRNLTAATVVKGASQVCQSVRDPEQKFRAEVPMDVILEKLIEDANLLNTPFNQSAQYLPERENFVEWMFDLAEKLHV
jgi:hypothetical protein